MTVPVVPVLDCPSTVASFARSTAVVPFGPLVVGPGFVPGPAAVEAVTAAQTEPGPVREFYDSLVAAVESTQGILGLAVVFVYSFLIAFLLPLPSEIVLAVPLNSPFPLWAELIVIMFVSGVGKAAGSVFAFHIGQEAKDYGPVLRALRRSRIDVVEWSERKTIQVAQRWGYIGLTGVLCVPGFPDTLSIYAFSVLESDYIKFAAATFVGSIGRLIVTLVIFGTGSALL